MSDNEGGGAAADVDFNDDLFTCANVRFIQCYRIARKFSILFLLCVLIFFLRQQRTRASSSSSSSSLTLLLLMKNNLKHTVRCCHQVQDCCRLREWYVFIKLFFFSSRLCFVRRTDSKYFSAALFRRREKTILCVKLLTDNTCTLYY